MIWLFVLAALALAGYELYVNEAGPNSIPGYAKTAGFSGTDLAIAVAIAFAESSGDANAVGDNGNSYGLWQINVVPNHPEYQSQVDDGSIFDPQTNANDAFAIYSAAGNSFSPWTTFKTGAYQQYLSADSAAPASDDTDDSEDTIDA
jgi:hypothetical protein